MKKTISLFLIISLAFCFVSCSAVQNNNQEETTKTVSQTLTERTTLKADKGETTTSAATSKKSSFEKLNDAFSGTTKAKSTTKKSTTKTSKATTKKSTKQAADNKNYCYITVECKEILSHKDNLAENHSKYVPKDGYLINSYKVEVANNSTAYSVLKEACKHYGYYLNEENSTYGVYVKGINQIDEKDCGRESGWTFLVNGKYPSKSADKISVSKNDKITFHYICEYE